MKFALDKTAAATAVRTAGALMVGNAFVGVLVLEKSNWLGLSLLLALGISAIIFTSLIRKE